MMSIIKDFQYACLALSLFTAGASAFSSTNAGLVSSTPTTKSSIPLYMSSAAAMLPEGLVKTVVDGGSPGALPIQRGDVVTVKYTCYSTTGDDSDNILLARSDSQKMVCIVEIKYCNCTLRVLHCFPFSPLLESLFCFSVNLKCYGYGLDVFAFVFAFASIGYRLRVLFGWIEIRWLF